MARSVSAHKKTEENTPTNKLESNASPLPQHAIVDIYFPRISFAGCPFTWYYYRSEDLAIWTEKLYGKPKDECTKQTLLTKLQSIPGVSIVNGDAVIRKAGDFCLQHQMEYMPMEDENQLSVTFS